MISSLITGLFIVSLFNSGKILNLGSLHFTYGLISMSIAFCLIDVINQLRGKEQARKVTINALLTRFILYPFALPIVGWRIVLATEVVTFFSQVVVDIPIFHKLKEYRMPFFVRTNLSNILTSALGAAIFILVAFLGVKPNIEQLIFGQIFMRILLSLLISPFTSLIVKLSDRHAKLS